MEMTPPALGLSLLCTLSVSLFRSPLRVHRRRNYFLQLLHLGSRGFKARFAQRLLNKALTRDRAAGTPLTEDGRFGPLTIAAIRAFQSRHPPLVVDSTIGPQTWRALGLTTEQEHNSIIQFGQPTTTSCWSAAATSIFGNQSVGPGAAGLATNGGLLPSIENLQIFANGLGWTMLNFSPSVSELVSQVQRKPLWIAAQGAHFAHAVVLSGVYSDGDSSGDGTMFRIHDPWPVNVGNIYGSFANPLMIMSADGVTQVPTTNFFVLIPA